MNDSIQIIPITRLILIVIPVLAVIGIHLKWSLDTGGAIHAIARMLIQLLLIGYVLVFIFESDSAWLVLAILSVMALAASWISLRTLKGRRSHHFKHALFSIAIGGGSTLLIVTQGVLDLQPWYSPRYMIPLAGMIFANSMNSISLAAERLYAELQRDVPYDEARKIAFQTALIPIMNSLFAVGIVSLPGMMTGQILSGVSALIAVRYQIMVMCMIFGSAGLAAASFLIMSRSSR